MYSLGQCIGCTLVERSLENNVWSYLQVGIPPVQVFPNERQSHLVLLLVRPRSGLSAHHFI